MIVLLSAASTLGLLVRGGYISPLAYGLTFLPLFAAVAGFWFMRWWAVVLGVLTACYVVFVSAFDFAPLSPVAIFAYAAPMLIIALLHRSQFR